MKIYILFHLINTLCAIKIYKFTNGSLKEWKADDSYYESVKLYYSNQTVSKEAVLGIGNSSEIDLEYSRAFISDVMSWEVPPDTKTALDMGAGYGRVTKGILIKIFDKVDMVEQDEKFADAAKDFIGKDNFKLGTIYKIGVQDFDPEKFYDVIWIQGILEYLIDDDATGLLEKCRLALNPRGVIVIKENVMDGDMSLFDEGDFSISRTFDHIRSLWDAAGLQLVNYDLEEDHHYGYMPVLIAAVVPVDRQDVTVQTPDAEL